MKITNTRAAEIAEAEADVARLEKAQSFAEMGNDSYYTDGSKRRDDAEIRRAKDRLAALLADTEPKKKINSGTFAN